MIHLVCQFARYLVKHWLLTIRKSFWGECFKILWKHFSFAFILFFFFQLFLFNSVQFSRSVVSDSLWPNESQHARPPCPSPTPGGHSDSCPSSLLCHPAISWRLITLKYCSGFCHTLTQISHGFTRVPHPDPPSRLPPHPIPLGLPSTPALSTCSHGFNLGWWSVSPLIEYLFQCCSLWTSHPCLLPQSLKVCSVHLCLFFCFAYRVVVTIFLNSIYMC